MKRAFAFLGMLLVLAVPLTWWYSVIAPYADGLNRAAVEITFSFVAIAALMINVVGVAAWIAIVPRIGDYIVKIVAELYQVAHWSKVRARSEAKQALAVEGGQVMTDEERDNWRARESVLQLIRAAINVNGAESAIIPGWRQLDGWGSKQWQETIEIIRAHVVTRQGGSGGGVTMLGAGYTSLRQFCRMVERGAVRLAPAREDDAPLPTDPPTDENA